MAILIQALVTCGANLSHNGGLSWFNLDLKQRQYESTLAEVPVHTCIHTHVHMCMHAGRQRVIHTHTYTLSRIVCVPSPPNPTTPSLSESLSSIRSSQTCSTVTRSRYLRLLLHLHPHTNRKSEAAQKCVFGGGSRSKENGSQEDNTKIQPGHTLLACRVSILWKQATDCVCLCACVRKRQRVCVCVCKKKTESLCVRATRLFSEICFPDLFFV